MNSKSLRLREGVTADGAIRSLTPLVTEGANLADGGGGVSPNSYRARYLQWMESVETVIRHCFAAPDDVWLSFGTTRHALLLSLNADIARPHATIAMEARAQVRRLQDLIAKLAREHA